jgi:glycopeptide antibiotics resistance protein
MKELALIAYGFLCTVLPALLLYCVLHSVYQAKGMREPRYRLVMILILSVYVAGVFYFTGTGTIYHIRQYGLDAVTMQTNLILFSAESIDVVAYLLNVVLFLPFGFLLPLLWPKLNRFWKILLSGAAFSLLIELSQLLNIRNSDIDDLLLNTLGAVAGFVLYRAFSAVTKREEHIGSGFRAEAWLYFLAMFLGRFLLFHEFGFAKILYGF